MKVYCLIAVREIVVVIVSGLPEMNYGVVVVLRTILPGISRQIVITNLQSLNILNCAF
jgi:hypothetical protein